jgi:hypothetical protein
VYDHGGRGFPGDLPLLLFGYPVGRQTPDSRRHSVLRRAARPLSRADLMGGVDEVDDVCFCFVFLESTGISRRTPLELRVPGANPAPAWLYNCTPAGAGARSPLGV